MKPKGWLTPLSLFYQAGVQLRNRFYDRGIIAEIKVDASVISIGNISVGGTGKTPFVKYLLEKISQLTSVRKQQTAIITRGYKGKAKGTHIVMDGKRLLSSPELAGDEAVMLARESGRTVIIKDKDRVRGAQYAISHFKSKVILLDDGFQHRKMARDLDIVLLDAQNPLGNRRVLPAGFLREPSSALARADVVVLSKAIGTDLELKKRCEMLQDLIKKPVIATRLKSNFWRKLNQSEIQAVDEIKGKNVIVFAGIAQPGSFFKLVEGFKPRTTYRIPLPDHYKYSKKQIDKIAREFSRQKADWMVTTSKDAVKMPAILNLLPLYYLDISMETVYGESVLDDQLLKALQDQKA